MLRAVTDDLSPMTCHLLPVTGDLWRTPSHGVRPRCPVPVPFGPSDLLDIRGEGTNQFLNLGVGLVSYAYERHACSSHADPCVTGGNAAMATAAAKQVRVGQGVYRRPAAGGWHDSRSLL